MTRTWRDVLTFDSTWTADGLARATVAVEKAQPFLHIERVQVPVKVSWRDYGAESDGLSNAHAGVDYIEMNAHTVDQATSSWEETLVHELVHIMDKQVMPESARDAVMAMVKGCRATNVNGVCTDPVTPSWWGGPYMERCGELLAELAARFIWYGDTYPSGEWGVYTFAPGSAAAIAAHVLDTLPTPSSAPEPSPVTAPAPTPTGAHVTLPGIDVSGSYQTPAQVTGEVTAGRARFVIVKASEGVRTAGARHDELVAAARAAGALVGHYHYAWANQDPQAEAHNFLTRAAAQPGDLLVLDLEEAKDGASWERRLAYALDWLHTVRAATGADPVIYLNPTWAHGLLAAATASQRVQLTSCPLWIAAPSDPAGKPRDVGWPVWTLHQFSIAGGVDRNVLNGDAGTWAVLAVPSKPVHVDTTPPPAPVPAPLPLPTTGDPMVRSFTVPVVFTGEDTATADITFDGFRGTPEVLVTPGTPNYKAASYARTATGATIAVKCDWPSTSTVFCSVLVVGEPA